jgi:peptidoglycan/xylan/chitin deacetylase (PgdA/CDA1 family)
VNKVLKLGLVVGMVVTILCVAMPSAEAVAPGTSITHIDTTQKVVALTFDDAWNPVYMTAILDALQAGGVRATFFPTGGAIWYEYQHNADLARRAIAEGHDIGSHSYSHVSMPNLTSAQMLDSIQRTERVFALAGIRNPAMLFRPPGGWYTTTLLGNLKNQGYANILWTFNANDIAPGMTVAKCVRDFMSRLKPGAIVLMHTQNPIAPAALPEIIRQAKARGYRFVTLREALFAWWQNIPRYQQNCPQFHYEGTWGEGWSTASLAGSFKSTSEVGAKVTVNFDGTYLGWVARTTPWYGKALVTLDGGEPVVANCHYSGGVSKWTVYNTGTLPAGPHTLTIECVTGAATGPGISVDAFDILGTATP